jgi:hypothetical protein
MIRLAGCVALDNSIAIACAHPVRFELTLNGRTHLITALTQAVYSVFASQGGFCVGLAFKQDDAQRADRIAEGKGALAQTTASRADSVPSARAT